MPIRYERDDARRRVVITFPGPYQASDGLDAINRHHAGGAWTYGVLYDLRSLSGQPNIADLKSLMEIDIHPPAGESRQRGPVAVVAPNPIIYSMACTYAAMGRATMLIEVFRDWQEADQWLTAQTSVEP
jgi:hypothetical protein